ALTALATKKELVPERLAAIEDLRHFGKGAIKPLVQAMQNPFTEQDAAESLAHLLDNNKTDDFAQALLPHLPDLLSSPYLQGSELLTGNSLNFALSKHGAKLLPKLEKDLAGKDVKAQRTAASALTRIGAHLVAKAENPDLAKKILKVLEPHFQSADADVR